MKYVLRRAGDNSYVTPAGSAKSYTKDVTKARIFTTREEAVREQCENETIVNLDSLFG